ncbi:hypothetical protein AMATHDRAFT_72402 [Amanita thiersii Skay4041]|uniref:AB hydrolase-1 domain-containing protein n=1 Tax=Amanita thiersii Skay4041 TaxID=703135 RepID=A0A2A9NYF1_9AGAR|nr:hypothetical protein AMATHDRAFT_72402 [Amanita thiersii Skay4041]
MRLPLSFRTTWGSFILHQPSPDAPREAPTPLVFLSAVTWDPESGKGMTHFSSMFAEKGFTCMQVDMLPPTNSETLSASELMTHFDAELKHSIRSAMIPFAPVIVARSAACIIAQTYISSNPATGLCLISPPVSNRVIINTFLKTSLEEFNFEPRFPVTVLATSTTMRDLKRHNRLCQDPYVKAKELNSLEDEEILVNLEYWLDDLGI